MVHPRVRVWRALRPGLGRPLPRLARLKPPAPLLENDLLEAIIGLPTDMFYNTGINTYVWIVSNRKPEARQGKVQLIDAGGFWQKMRKSLGSKRKELSAAHIEDITQIFGRFEEVTREGRPISRILDNEAFGYRALTIERPLRDAEGNVPLGEDEEIYFRREVLPHAPDAWIDHEKTRTGFEIPFNRFFYVFQPPRPLGEIDAELKGVTDKILELIAGLSA